MIHSIQKQARQWTYQTCTEYGFYQTSDNASFVFGNRFDVDFFIRQCTDIYGTDFDTSSQSEAILRTNTYYGELHAETTNVIYIHGSIDPWHALGLTETMRESMPAIYIKGKTIQLFMFYMEITIFCNFRNGSLCQHVRAARRRRPPA